MALKMKSQDTRTKSNIQFRRGAIPLAENLGGVPDPLSAWGIYTLQHYLQSSLAFMRRQIGYI